MDPELDKKLRRWTKSLAAAALLGWTAPAFAQEPTSESGVIYTKDSMLVNHRRTPAVEVQPVPSAMPSQSCPPGAMPGSPSMPGTMPPGTPGETPGTMSEVPGTTPNPMGGLDAPGLGSLGNEAGGAGGGAVSFNTPNIMGNFLGTGRAISFGLTNTGGTLFGGSFPASTRSTNSQIADDNSPIPRDRVGYRFNYFNNSGAITGVGSAPDNQPYNPATFAIDPLSIKEYDTYLSNFNFEKTFANGNASIEVRLPMVTAAASHQTLVFGQRTGPNMQTAGGLSGFGFTTTRTPDQSTGRYGTEIGNMQVILKGVICKSSDFLLSGGVGVGVPTADDVNITVLGVTGASNSTGPHHGTGETMRDFTVANDTWGLSPFLAYVYAPSGRRWFTQGFLEFETPMNSTGGRFRETIVPADPTDPSGLATKIDTAFRLREQALMHLSTSTGFWAYQDPNAAWIRGVAPAVELHYTQSLTKGRQVTLPSDNIVLTNNITGDTLQRPAPTVGREGNVDFFDVTLGTTFQLGDRATVAFGFSFPLLSGDQHRTYDYEAQVQLNYYFGAGLGSRRTPNNQ
jgi:hypothetical protein